MTATKNTSKTPADQSHLDRKYFVNEHVYNCPFCKRRHVCYELKVRWQFDWSNEKRCHVYTVACRSCGKTSMHLSYEEIQTDSLLGSQKFCPQGQELDDLFFYSVPTSFFALDERIPRRLREIFTEAEGCLKSNFLTGASACARKVVYELGVLEGASGQSYDERIKSLKALKPEVDPSFFDTLTTIQQVTSDNVHKNAYDGWSSRHLRVILAALSDILDEIYVIPKVRQERRVQILRLKDEVLGERGETTAEEPTESQ
jgi:hypothetical protein